MAILKSELVVSLKDDVTGPAGKAAASLRGVGQAGKDLAGVEARLAAMKARAPSAPAQAKAAAAIARPSSGISEGLKRDLSALDLGSRDLRNLVRMHVRMVAEQEKALGSIGNAKVRAQVVDAHRQEMETRLRGKAQALAAERDMTRELTAQAGVLRALTRERALAGREARRRAGHAAGAVAGVVGVGGGAYVAERGARSAVKAATAGRVETARQTAIGVSPEHEAIGAMRANELSRQFPSLDPVGLREHFRNLHVNLAGNAEAARDTLESVARAQVILSNFKPQVEAQQDLARIIKAAENAGFSDQPKKFSEYLNGAVKGMQLFGDTLRGDDFFQYTSKARTAVPGLSPRFLGAIVPSLLDDQGGATVGQAHYTAHQTIVGNKIDKKARPHFQKYGLLDNKGGVIGRDTFIEDPFQWATEVLKPRLEKQGVKVDETNLTPFIDAITPLFRDRNTADFIGKMLIKEGELRKNEKRFKEVNGLEKAETVRQENPNVALDAAGTQLKTLLGQLADPLLPAATASLNAFADATAKVTESVRKNPDVAATVAKNAAVPAVTGGAWGLGWLAKSIVGDANGILANVLRQGGTALETGGRVATKATVLPQLLSIVGDLTAAAGKQYGYREASGPGSKRHGRAVRKQLDEQYAGQPIDPEPETAKRDGLDKEIATARAHKVRQGAMWGDTAFGKAVQAKIDARITALEEAREALAETQREMAKGNARSRPQQPPPADETASPGIPAPNIPLPPPRPRLPDTSAPALKPGLDTSEIDAAAAKSKQALDALGATIVPKVDASALDTAEAKARAAEAVMALLGGTITPQVNMAAVDGLIAKLREALSVGNQLGAVVSTAKSQASKVSFPSPGGEGSARTGKVKQAFSGAFADV